MSRALAISAPLRRSLKDGSRFEKLLPNVNCESTNVGNGKNNTIEGAQLMADVVKKYHHQTAKIAPLLKANSLQKTTNNIYGFLYNHIQYMADEQLQRLYSPACAFKKRKTGIDCKSYSIFASSLLTNLGITHFIRQVKQPGPYADFWTHVYVMVPKNQKTLKIDNKTDYLIIDPTTHTNEEVLFLETNDLKMQQHKYVAMNAPGSVTSSYTSLTPIEVKAISQLKVLLTKQGFSLASINQIADHLKTLINQGYSRNDIRVYVSPAGIHIKPNANAPGKIFGTGANGRTTQTLWDRNWQKATYTSKTSQTTSTQQDTSESEELDEEFFTQVTSSSWFGSTFGAIFSNGFDFSCWGSSYSPTQAEENLRLDLPFMIKQTRVISNPTTATLNNFLRISEGYIKDAVGGQNSRFAKCTRKGHELREVATKNFRDAVITALRKAGLTVTENGSTQGSISTDFPGYRSGQGFNLSGYNHKTYLITGTLTQTVIPPNSDTIILGGGSGSSGGSIGGVFGDVFNTGNDTNNPTNPNTNGGGYSNPTTPTTYNPTTTPTTNTNTTKIIAGSVATLGALIFLMPKIKTLVK